MVITITTIVIIIKYSPQNPPCLSVDTWLFLRFVVGSGSGEAWGSCKKRTTPFSDLKSKANFLSCACVAGILICVWRSVLSPT